MEVIMMISIESDAANLRNRLVRSGYERPTDDVLKSLVVLAMAGAEAVSEHTGESISWSVLLPESISRVSADGFAPYDVLYALEAAAGTYCGFTRSSKEIHQDVMHDLTMCHSAGWNWYTVSEVIDGE